MSFIYRLLLIVMLQGNHSCDHNGPVRQGCEAVKIHLLPRPLSVTIVNEKSVGATIRVEGPEFTYLGVTSQITVQCVYLATPAEGTRYNLIEYRAQSTLHH